MERSSTKETPEYFVLIEVVRSISADFPECLLALIATDQNNANPFRILSADFPECLVALIATD